MQIIKIVSKCFLLLLTGLSVGVLYIYCSGFLATEFIQRGAVPSTAERTAGIATLVVLFITPALPLYKLFPTRAVTAAVGIGCVPLLLSVTLAHQVNAVVPRPFATSLAIAEGASCWLAIVVGAWAVKSFVNLISRPDLSRPENGAGMN